jgi:hypothetical protein
MPNTPPPLRYTDWPKRLSAAGALLAVRVARAFANHGLRVDMEIAKVTAALNAGEERPDFDRLIAEAEREYTAFAATAAAIAVLGMREGLSLSLTAAFEMTQAQLGSNAVSVMAGWNRPDPRALDALAALVDGPAFRQAAGRFGPAAADAIAEKLRDGLAQGLNPRTIAASISGWNNTVPKSWAETTARTAQLWSYRMGTHETYRANEDIIGGWMWWADLSPRTCLSCISQHGSIHKNDETLTDHHRGRCVALPIVRGTQWADTVRSGPEWFDGLSERTQRRMMGPSRYDAYSDGAFDWSRASSEYHSDIYGPMLRVASLEEMGLERVRP